MKNTLFLALGVLVAAPAFADSYFFGVGINDYDIVMDADGMPMFDEYGDPVSFDLQGCVNDVHYFSRYFEERAGVAADHSTVMTDREASAENFVKKFGEVLSKLKPGDHFYFSFSGHGTQIEGGNEPDKKDEYIVLRDFVLVSDDIFAQVAKDLRQSGVDCTFVFDSCFSGGMSMDTPGFQKVRGKSLAVKGMRHRIAHTRSSSQLFKKPKSVRSDAQSLFFFASKEDQTSADVTLADGTSHGAFTMFLEKVVTEEPECTVETAMDKVNKLLTEAGLAQRSTLDSSVPERKRRPIVG